MKKKLLYGFAVLAIAAVAAVNVNLRSNRYGLSDVSLANVEALARTETTEEFAAIGCECSEDKEYCYANNGNTYIYARNKQ